MTSERTMAEQLAKTAVDFTYQDLPEEVVESVRMRVLDTLGIAIAACTLDTSRAARRWAVDQGGAPHASAIGVPERLPAPLAAFVNGTLAHSLDYDDTHLPSILHPSAAVIPAALAAAERSGASGCEVVQAVTMGLEVCVRLGMAGYDEATSNSAFFENGQHATSICGAMGAAVSASLLLASTRVRSQSERQQAVVNAMGLAASMASGIIEANRTGGTVKRVHCGWAAHAGVSAAGLVEYGLSGPSTVLEGRFGFFQAWLHGNYRADAVTAGLGESWVAPEIFFKPYPANHFTHTAIDAAAALRADGIRPEQVADVQLGVATPTVRTIGEPIEIKRAPQTGYMAQFSGPYAVAVGLLGGSGLAAGLDDFTDALALDPERREIMAKVSVVADPTCDRIFPHQFPAVLTVRLTDGSTLVKEVLVNRGGPQNPLSFSELAQKFQDNARRVLGQEATDSLAERCRKLQTYQSIDELFTDLRPVDPISEL